MNPFPGNCRALAGLCLAASTLLPSAAHACIWPYQEPAYWQELLTGDDGQPLPPGQVGIVDDSWTYPSLFHAWRGFEGIPLSAAETRIVMGALPELVGEDSVEPAETAPKPAPSGVEAWQAALGRALGTEEGPWVDPDLATDIPDPKEEGGTRFVYFLNCLSPAFDTAAAALDERLARWGKDSKNFQEWLRGQRKVFENCSALGEDPPELDASWPADLRADRQYQIAAADFYALRYEAAAARFRRIAADKSSPWTQLAALAAARCTLRRELFAQAAGEFRAIVADPGLAEVHASAGRLARYAELRISPEAAADRLEKELRAKGLPADPLDRLYEANWMANHLEASPERPLIYFLQSIDDWRLPATDVYAAWKAHPSAAALVATMYRALQSANGIDAVQQAAGTPVLGKAESEALVTAAAKIGKGSAAYLSARYYRAALLHRVLGRPDEARAELDHLIAEKIGDRGSVQRLRHERAHLARDWNELIQYGLLTPVGETDEEHSRVYSIDDVGQYSDNLKEDSRLLIPVAIEAIDRFASLAELARLQQSAELPSHYRGEIALIGFLRAALQGKETEAAAFADAATRIEGDNAAFFSEWRAAASGDDKRFAAAFVALKNPGLSIDLWPTWGRGTPTDEIDELRQNWWCPVAELPAERPAFLEGKEAPPDGVLGWSAGPNQLGRIVLDYAKNHGVDPRLPEALHRTVRATRFGCISEPYLEVSKTAFNLLHKKFPKNEWTAQTPYFFE